MEAVQSKFAGMSNHLGIFKEPRGLIRVFQVIFAILAIATACNGRSSVALNVGGVTNAVTTTWSYPYKLANTAVIRTSDRAVLSSISTGNDPESAAEFFVFTGSTSLILSLAFILLYVFMHEQYINKDLYPVIDFTITLIWTIFWIAGSSAWAQAVTSIRTQTAWENIRQRSGLCLTTPCSYSVSGNYANIIVSVIFGYLNFILWAGSTWFIFKETRFFKGRTLPQQPQPQPNTYSDIGSPSMPQPSYIRSPGQ
ncbi:unnamed protein product [Adineta steineri]|uniref:MARVEL domain-containing protein n=1 Tax=Adineta steineri TaxID=433720 RepID=A0A819KDG0_9BILA|nr:unnamed protein product [Adineta steineri]CAF3947206.1 unnamed protein product [Adineta steineri]